VIVRSLRALKVVAAVAFLSPTAAACTTNATDGPPESPASSATPSVVPSTSPGTPSGPPPTGSAPSGPPPTGTELPPVPSRPMRELRPRVEAAIHVGGTPDWQLAAFGSVWVANDDISIVQRIDPATDRVSARIHLVPFAKPCAGMAAGFGSVWIPDCSTQDVDRVDPDTDQVIARVHSGIADFESYIGVGAGSVWIISAPDELTRIDAATNRVSARIRVPDGSVAVRFGHGFAWVTNNSIDVVIKVDPETNSAAGSIPVGHDPRFLTIGEGAIWVLNQGDGTVSRIDPASEEVRAIDADSPGEGGCIETGFGAVWITVPGFPFTKIDAESGEVREHFRGPGGDCLSVGSGSVWLSNLHFGVVWRIPPS